MDEGERHLADDGHGALDLGVGFCVDYEKGAVFSG